MIKVISQGGDEAWLVDQFWIKPLGEGLGYAMQAIARPELEQIRFIDIGWYKFYRQALDVFAQLDYEQNDLMCYRKRARCFQMPEPILDERECMRRYGRIE